MNKLLLKEKHKENMLGIRTFLLTFFESIHHQLTDELSNKEFLNQYIVTQKKVLQDIEEYIEKIDYSLDWLFDPDVDLEIETIDVYMILGEKAGSFQLEVAKLLENHFPNKYPDYFFFNGNLQVEVDKLTNSLEMATKELKTSEANYKRLKTRHENTKLEFNESKRFLETELNEIKSEKESLHKKNVDLEEQIKLEKKQAQLFLDEKNVLAKQLHDLGHQEVTIDTLTSDLELERSKNGYLQEMLDEKDSLIKKLNDSLNKRLEEQQKKHLNEFEEETNSKTVEDYKYLEQQLEETRQQLLHYMSENLQLNERIEELTELYIQQKEYTLQIEEQVEQLKKQQAITQEIQSEILKLQKMNENLRNTMQDKSDELTKLKSTQMFDNLKNKAKDQKTETLQQQLEVQKQEHIRLENEKNQLLQIKQNYEQQLYAVYNTPQGKIHEQYQLKLKEIEQIKNEKMGLSNTIYFKTKEIEVLKKEIDILSEELHSYKEKENDSIFKKFFK